MLKVQEYLKNGKTFEDLTSELGIVCTFHPEHPLVILNYDQIESPKGHPIVRECRALVLNSKTFEVVAKSFRRFFNWGEMADEMGSFDFSKFVSDEKVDGSLCLIYNYNGQLFINTRGSFAMGILEGYDQTWEHAIGSALSIEVKEQIVSMLNENPNRTLVCEFCSLYNKVVRTYNTPTVFLLGVFDGLEEIGWNEVDSVSSKLGMKRPIRYEFSSIEQVEKFVIEIGNTDKTFEGLVIRDSKGNRWKVKNPTYLALHRMRGNNNIFLDKYIVPLVLAGEKEEIFTYFPEIKPKYEIVEKKINDAFEALIKTFNEVKGIEDQKTFALSIKGKTEFTGLLFLMKKKYGKDMKVEDLKSLWRESGDCILKVLFS